MSLENLNKSLCRICLKDNVFFEWIEAIFELSGPSYRECYYQYTRLQEEDDPYPTMLCPDCANDLRNTHQLVEKAIASDKKLKEHKTYDIFNEYKIEPVTLPNTSDSLNVNEREGNVDMYLTDVTILETYPEGNAQISAEQILQKSADIEISNSNNCILNEDSSSMSESDCLKISTSKQQVLSLLCMYCSKICNSKGKLRNHERTHEKRERTETCLICGLKFFDQLCLKLHMDIHIENRERKFKCEFCIKSFFRRGGLNVHRRIHLGQMVKCQLCPKEFFCQYDLNRHMRSHDVMPITLHKDKINRNKTKYFMDCKTCSKKVSWENWEIHKAKHLNQRLFQCSICSKEYYSRNSMCKHLKQHHDVSREQYAKYIIKINQTYKPRLTRLIREQNIVIE